MRACAWFILRYYNNYYCNIFVIWFLGNAILLVSFVFYKRIIRYSHRVHTRPVRTHTGEKRTDWFQSEQIKLGRFYPISSNASVLVFFFFIVFQFLRENWWFIVYFYRNSRWIICQSRVLIFLHDLIFYL